MFLDSGKSKGNPCTISFFLGRDDRKTKTKSRIFRKSIQQLDKKGLTRTVDLGRYFGFAKTFEKTE